MHYLRSKYFIRNPNKEETKKEHKNRNDKTTKQEHKKLNAEKAKRIHYINGYNDKPGKEKDPKDWYQAYEKYKDINENNEANKLYIQRNYKSVLAYKKHWYFIGGKTTVNTILTYLLGNKDRTTHKFSYVVKFYFSTLELGAVMREYIKKIESKQELDGKIKYLRDNLFHSNFWFIDYAEYNKTTDSYTYTNVFKIIQDEIKKVFTKPEANKMLNEFNSGVDAILQRLKLPIKNGEIIKNLNYKMHKDKHTAENDKNYALVKIAKRLIKQLYEYENSK